MGRTGTVIVTRPVRVIPWLSFFFHVIFRASLLVRLVSLAVHRDQMSSIPCVLLFVFLECPLLLQSPFLFGAVQF